MSERKHVVIIGSGGHAREVLEIIRSARTTGGPEPIGFIDEDVERDGDVIDGLPVLGGFDWFDAFPRDVASVCAVGDPRAAARLVAQTEARGVQLVGAHSPHALISPRARLSAGVIVFPNVVVNTGAEIGRHTTLNVGSSVSHDSRVGEFSNINPGARIAGGSVLGDRCYVGMRAAVIHGVTIGDDVVIGAGAVVIDDLPPGVTAVGLPARIVKTRKVVLTG